jgi:hypothetical protein
MTLNPDGTRVLVSDTGGALVLRDAATGTALVTVDPAFFPADKAAYFPEWSPDGKSIAFTMGPRTSLFGFTFGLSDGEIALLPYNDGKFGPATILVKQDADRHFYPTWSPDGKWIAFCSAPAGSQNDPRATYDNAQARLRLIAAAGGPIYELGRATQGAGNTASWPKFTPFSQLGGQLLFIAFSSKIDYGFLKRDRTRPQLWLAAVDLRRLDPRDPTRARDPNRVIQRDQARSRGRRRPPASPAPGPGELNGSGWPP